MRTGIYDVYELMLWNRDRSADATLQVELPTPGQERLQTVDLDVMSYESAPFEQAPRGRGAAGPRIRLGSVAPVDAAPLDPGLDLAA